MCVAQTWMGGTLRPALAISLAFVVRISVMEDVRTFCLQFNGVSLSGAIEACSAYTWVSLSISRMAASRILALVTDRYMQKVSIAHQGKMRTLTSEKLSVSLSRLSAFLTS